MIKPVYPVCCDCGKEIKGKIYNYRWRYGEKQIFCDYCASCRIDGRTANGFLMGWVDQYVQEISFKESNDRRA